MKLVRNFSSLLDQPAEVHVHAESFRNRLLREGHVSGSKIIKIMVDFSARMTHTLQEMRTLLEPPEPDRSLDFSTFPDVPSTLFDSTPEKPVVPAMAQSVPSRSTSAGLRDILPQAEQRTEPKGGQARDRDVNALALTPSQPLPVCTTLLKEALDFSVNTTRGDLLNRLGAVSNPARTEPDKFSHMLEDTPPKQEPDRIDLTKSGSGKEDSGAHMKDPTGAQEESEEEVEEGIQKSESQEWVEGQDESDDDDTPPKQTASGRKPWTRQQKKTTPTKPKAPSKGKGSSSKKQRRGS